MLARVLALVVGLALLIATADGLQLLGSGSPSRAGLLRPVLQLVVLSAAWLLVNSPVEGRVLWVLVSRHGLTQADVLVVPPLLLAAVLAALHLRS